MDSVWIFNGVGGRFPSAVFADKASATRWISENRLTGTLTEYPVGISVFDWAVSKGKNLISRSK